MSTPAEHNFAGLLVGHLGETSRLVDAATGLILAGSQVSRLIVGFAAGFLSAGLQPGDRLLVSCAQSPASTLAYLGAMYAGIVPVPVEERLLATSGNGLAAKTKARALWSAHGTDCVVGDATEGANVLRIEGSFEPCSPAALAPSRCAESDLAALMPTSGSTGRPQLVMVTHGNLLSNTEAIIRSQRLGCGETALLVMPISYCFGASVMHTHLYQGGSVVFDSRFMFADKVINAINAHDCSTFAGVPLVYHALLRHSNLRSISLPRLRRFLQAGGALNTECIRELRRIVPNAEFFVMYGQTEATARISCLPPEFLNEKLGSAGVPLDNLEVRIGDENGQSVPLGLVGEIQVRGPSVCLGYFEDPESTARKYHGGWLKTGDLGSFDTEGYLWIHGRIDEFVKIRGRRVSFAEVESRIGAVAGVRECAAACVRHPEQGEGLALFVVAKDREDSVKERIQYALPSHWAEAAVKFVEELPRTANGKIARWQLATSL